jgi:site-specific recombinase XerC
MLWRIAMAYNVALHVRSVRIVREARPLRASAAWLHGCTAAQMHDLLRAVGESSGRLARCNCALVQLMLQTGLLAGKAVALRRRDVVLRERACTARGQNGESLKDREVPLNGTARRALRQLLELEPAAQAEAAVFRSGQSTTMPVRSIQDAISPPWSGGPASPAPTSPPTVCVILSRLPDRAPAT